MQFQFDRWAHRLLVDEILIVILELKFPLHLLDLAALLEQLLLHKKLFLTRGLSLSNQRKQLSSIFKLLAQFPELLCALGVPTASLSNLSNFSPTKADIWI